MTELQKNFIEKNIQLCSDPMDEQQTSMTESITSTTNSQLSTMMSTSSDQQIISLGSDPHLKFEPMVIEDEYPIIQCCFGKNDNDSTQPVKQILTCIFCQENSEVKLNSEALVLSAYIQKLVF